MDFNLSKEQLLVRQLVRDFAENEVKPIAAEIDETERFPRETVEKMAKVGLFGINIPKQYGGAGGDDLSYFIAVEEIAKVCATTAIILSAHNSLCSGPILAYGTEEQKQKYLVPLAKGEKLGAFALTEPNAGTDSAAQETSAVLDGDHWIFNGSKCFITNGGQADTYIIIAMTDKSKGNRGISAFIVEKDTPGFTIGKLEHKMGIRASATAELIFDNCIIPKENLLGEVNKGFKIAMNTLDGGRIGVAAQALGIAEGAFDEAVKYMNERVQFRKKISSFQGLQWMCADMKCSIESARLLVYRAAACKQAGKDFQEEAAMAKLSASRTAMDVTTKCVQLFGGYGYSREYPVERMMRDAKITEIYEGTSQVQQMVIAGRIFK